jgi:hypothetical protein
MHAEYQQLKAVGYFDAFNPPNTRELVQQILHKLACANSPQQALGYTCVPMRAQLTTAEELEAQQAANLELLVAAADQEAAADGGGDLLGESNSSSHLSGQHGRWHCVINTLCCTCSSCLSHSLSGSVTHMCLSTHYKRAAARNILPPMLFCFVQASRSAEATS